MSGNEEAGEAHRRGRRTQPVRGRRRAGARVKRRVAVGRALKGSPRRRCRATWGTRSGSRRAGRRARSRRHSSEGRGPRGEGSSSGRRRTTRSARVWPWPVPHGRPTGRPPTGAERPTAASDTSPGARAPGRPPGAARGAPLRRWLRPRPPKPGGRRSRPLVLPRRPGSPCREPERARDRRRSIRQRWLTEGEAVTGRRLATGTVAMSERVQPCSLSGRPWSTKLLTSASYPLIRAGSRQMRSFVRVVAIGSRHVTLTVTLVADTGRRCLVPYLCWV